MGQTDASDSASAEPPEPTNRGPSAAADFSLNTDSVAGLDEKWLRDRILAALDHLPRSVRRLDVAVLDDAAMTALHGRFHNLYETTDVLTFDATDAAQGEAIEVDIAVCADVARRQASAHGHPIERELLLYVVHGLLHCMGYDDHDEAGFAAMHEKEDRVLEAIGVGRTFTIGGTQKDSAPGGVGKGISPLHKDSAG